MCDTWPRTGSLTHAVTQVMKLMMSDWKVDLVEDNIRYAALC